MNGYPSLLYKLIQKFLVLKSRRDSVWISEDVFVEHEVVVSFPIGSVEKADEGHFYFADGGENDARVESSSSLSGDILETIFFVCGASVIGRICCSL